MKSLILATILTLLFSLFSSCRLGGNTTSTTAEYPEIILPLYKKVSANSLPLLELPLFVYDLENPSKSGFPKFKWITALYPLRQDQYPEGHDMTLDEGDGGNAPTTDLQTSFCFKYTYNIKTRELTEVIERPMIECDKGIILGRSGFTLLMVQIQDWLYGL